VARPGPRDEPLSRVLREEGVARGTEPCAKWPQVVLTVESRSGHLVAQGKTRTVRVRHSGPRSRSPDATTGLRPDLGEKTRMRRC
jgi:hypothetical protein